MLSITKSLCLYPKDGLKGKGRPRFTKSGRAYTPKTTAMAEDEIISEWISKHGMHCADYRGEIHMMIAAHKALPKSAPKRRIGEPHISKPDVDNIVKLVCDALNEVAYHDDSQITQLTVSKCNRLPKAMREDYYLIEITYIDGKEATPDYPF